MKIPATISTIRGVGKTLRPRAPALIKNDIKSSSSSAAYYSSRRGALSNRVNFCPEAPLHSPTPGRYLQKSRACNLNSVHVRFHRTDYDGPGKFDERETGSLLQGHSHEHSHEHPDEQQEQMKELLRARYQTRNGTYSQRGFTVGIGGPVGSGKTALTLALCRALCDKLPMGVVTNDIFTQEDAEFLVRNDAFGDARASRRRILPVETGGCPHAAIREDVSANLGALEMLTARILQDETEKSQTGGKSSSSSSSEDDSLNGNKRDSSSPLLLCESGGDNLAANFSSELADFTVYVIDVAGGDKVPRKGGPGITQSDLLIINKIDLAEAVGASLDVMKRDANKMRRRREGESGPTVFASVKNGVGLEEIIECILGGFKEAHYLAESVR